MHHVNWAALGHFLSQAWTVVGPLVGVLIGAWLTRSGERRQWLADQKRAEYREILSAMTSTMAEFPFLLDQRAPNRTDEFYKRKVVIAQKLQDRIFTATELDRLEIFRRLHDATEKLLHGGVMPESWVRQCQT